MNKAEVMQRDLYSVKQIYYTMFTENNDVEVWSIFKDSLGCYIVFKNKNGNIVKQVTLYTME